MLCLGAALLPLAAFPAAASAKSTWYAVRGPDKVFIVDMPAEPTYKVVDGTSPAARGSMAKAARNVVEMLPFGPDRYELEAALCTGATNNKPSHQSR